MNLLKQSVLAPIVIILIIVGVLVVAGGVWYWQKEPATPSITVISPNGGEKWEVGDGVRKNYKIEWKYNETPRGFIYIYIVSGDDPLHKVIIASSEKAFIERPDNLSAVLININQTSFSYTVPDDLFVPQSSTYRIKICLGVSMEEKMNCDESDASFSIVPSILVSSDETANWKTYRNEEYGFEIRYPQIGEVLVGTHYGGGIPSTGETQFAVKYQSQTDTSGPGEGFVIFSAMPLSSAPKQNAGDLYTLRQQIFGTLKERYGTENYTVKSFTVGSDKGVLYYLFTPGTPGGGSGGCSMSVEVFHDNSFFILPSAAALIYAPEVVSKDCTNYLVSNYDSNYRTVLSTLKFTK